MTKIAAGALIYVMDRCEFACELCGRWLGETRGYDWSVHHRLPGRMGGTKRVEVTLPANLVAICGSGTTGCHGGVESNRLLALAQGLLLHAGAVPALVAVDLRYGHVWLDNVGLYSYEAPVAA